jgi:hypothetical protein
MESVQLEKDNNTFEQKQVQSLLTSHPLCYVSKKGHKLLSCEIEYIIQEEKINILDCNPDRNLYYDDLDKNGEYLNDNKIYFVREPDFSSDDTLLNNIYYNSVTMEDIINADEDICKLIKESQINRYTNTNVHFTQNTQKILNFFYENSRSMRKMDVSEFLKFIEDLNKYVKSDKYIVPWDNNKKNYLQKYIDDKNILDLIEKMYENNNEEKELDILSLVLQKTSGKENLKYISEKYIINFIKCVNNYSYDNLSEILDFFNEYYKEKSIEPTDVEKYVDNNFILIKNQMVDGTRYVYMLKKENICETIIYILVNIYKCNTVILDYQILELFDTNKTKTIEIICYENIGKILDNLKHHDTQKIIYLVNKVYECCKNEDPEKSKIILGWYKNNNKIVGKFLPRTISNDVKKYTETNHTYQEHNNYYEPNMQ